MGGEQVRSSRSTVAASKETLMSVLNTRMLSTLIARNLDRNYGRLGVSTNRMSSGLRINSAADDTANISVRELLRSNVAVLNQGIRNANDAVSLVQTADGVETRLVYVDRDLLLIPSVAIHMNRKANDGYSYDPQTDMVPLMGLGLEKGSFRAIVAQAAGCEAGDILGTDLFLCLRQKGLVWGAEDQFISAQGLDDLQCAYGCFRGFMEAEEAASVPVFALLDNEEVGSLTKQGADGTFLADVAERICAAFGKNRAQAMAHSFMVSADNAHAVHPNHPEYADATHRPAMNGGPVIKHGVRYATDGASQAVFTALCRRADVPVQQFSNRSDMAGGSTLGNISNSHLSLNTVDIGLPQLAMHSCYETAGAKDTDYLIQAMTAFYGSSFQEENGRFTLNN